MSVPTWRLRDGDGRRVNAYESEIISKCRQDIGASLGSANHFIALHHCVAFLTTLELDLTIHARGEYLSHRHCKRMLCLVSELGSDGRNTYSSLKLQHFKMQGQQCSNDIQSVIFHHEIRPTNQLVLFVFCSATR